MRNSGLPVAAVVAVTLVGVAGLGLGGVAVVHAVTASGHAPNAAGQLITESVKAISDLEADHTHGNPLQEAKGVFIIPPMVKGAVGNNGGQGVLLKHTANGWSEPAFLSLGTMSLDPRADGAGGESVMLLMTDKALDDFTKANDLTLGANTGLTVVHYLTGDKAPAGKGDIVIWSSKSGTFAGHTVGATDITANTQEDRNFYGEPVTTERILAGTVPNMAAAHPLVSALPKER